MQYYRAVIYITAATPSPTALPTSFSPTKSVQLQTTPESTPSLTVEAPTPTETGTSTAPTSDNSAKPPGSCCVVDVLLLLLLCTMLQIVV